MDKILTSAGLEGKVAAAAKRLVNAQEPPLLDYNYKMRSQVRNYFSADIYCGSDRNPTMVGFALGENRTGPAEPESIANFEFDVPDPSHGAVLSGSLPCGGGSCVFTEGGAPAFATPSPLPANVQFPYRLLAMQLQEGALASTVTVMLNLPEPADSSCWKCEPTAGNEAVHCSTIPFVQTDPQQRDCMFADGGLVRQRFDGQRPHCRSRWFRRASGRAAANWQSDCCGSGRAWMLGVLCDVLADIIALRARRRTGSKASN